MARVANPWIGYLDRSFQQIKQSLLTRLMVNNPEITDHSETNLLVIIISMFSGIAEMLNYYIDNFARESFIGTARRFASMVKLVRLVDYRIKARVASSVTLTFTALDALGDPVALTGIGLIPQGTQVSTDSGYVFLTDTDLSIPVGGTGGTVGAREVTKITGLVIGVTDGTTNQALSLGTEYVHDSVTITINGDTTWQLVDTLGLSGPTDKHFVVEIDTDGLAKLIFGDGVNGAIPPNPFNVTADFETCIGPNANVDADTLVNILDSLSLPGVTTVSVTNVNPASGGTLYEDVGKIRVSAPLSIRTLDRAVTYQDYEDIGQLAPGVGLAKVDFDCGKTVDLYIAPEGGGIAQLPLINSTQLFLDKRKMVTTFIKIYPAGETRLNLSITATAKFREDTTIARQDIIDALVEYGSFENQVIGRKIRTSDIIALVDNLDKIDYLSLDDIRSIPYARPINHYTPLSWSRKTRDGSSAIASWKLVYTGSNFTVFRDTIFKGIATTGSPFIDSDDIIKFTINAGPYIIGQTWTFNTYPIGGDIELSDFTLPLVKEGDLTIIVNKQ